MWYKNSAGQSRKILPDQYKKRFANKQIVCVEYDNLDGDQEREIFQVSGKFFGFPQHLIYSIVSACPAWCSLNPRRLAFPA